jgi:hypothetical protein
MRDSKYQDGWNAAMTQAAKIADQFADTKPNLEKSDNPSVAMVIASIMSETGAKVAAAIRAEIASESMN